MPRSILGQRHTRQRDAILEILQAAAGPLTVPELHARAQEVVAGLGIATVYRTLKLLQEAKLIQTVVLPSGETRYEPTTRGHHHHFHCRACGSVYDLEGCPIQIPRDRPYADGFYVDDHEVTLYGTCPSCQV